MLLKINKKKNTYFLNGKVINTTSSFLVDYFEKKISKKKKLTLNLDNTVEIDKIGLIALKQLMNLATLNNKKFLLVGYGCKEIYDDLYEAKVA
jgi:anti-anti-sigma regulatory factor